MWRLLAGLSACIAILVAVPAAIARTHPYAGYAWGNPDAKGNHGGPVSTPTAVSGIPNSVVQVATTNSDDYALDSTGAVWAWGAAGQGELGDGHPSSSYVATPMQVRFPAGVTIAKLAAPGPYDTMMAIDTHGDVWGWGDNRDHELCVSQTMIHTPVQLPLSGVTLATGAGDHALYDAGGILYGCGANNNGDLGDGTTDPSSSPRPVTGLPAGQSIAAITSSFHDSGVLLSNGTYYDWGLGGGGQLGDGALTDSDVPVQVPLGSPAEQVSAGGSLSSNGQSIALLRNGEVLSWGVNANGQLGNGTTKSSASPTPVSIPAGVSFVYVDSGGASEYAVDSTGDTWSWGSDQDGQLGLGTVDMGAHPLPASPGVHMHQIWSTAGNVYGY